MKAIPASLILFFFLAICLPHSSFAQTDYTKTLNVLVVDSKTGAPVAKAEVIAKGLFSRKKTTGADGKAVFEITFFTASLLINVEVNMKDGYGNIVSSSKVAVPMVQTQETYSITAPVSTNGKELTVTVIDEKSNPVAGARVDVDQRTGYTSANGAAVFEDMKVISGGRPIPIRVDKYGFNVYSSSTNFNRDDDHYSYAVILKSEKGYKIIKVHAVSTDDSKPVAGVEVKAVGKGLLDTYTATTDRDGNAGLVFTSSGDFTVSAKHPTFFEENQPLTVMHLDDDKNYSLEFGMKRKAPLYESSIEVYVNDIDGKPLPDATISFAGIGQGYSNATDAKGYIRMNHKMIQGEVLNLKVTKEGYKTEERAVMVGENQRKEGAVAVPNDIAKFVLQKGTTGKLQFVAQVLDHTTNKPVPLADVVIKSYNGNAVSQAAQTNKNGEASLYVDESVLKNGKFRLVASANNYEEQWSDISPDLQQSNNGKRYLSVYLKPKKKGIPEEKYYGAYKVDLSSWVPTGVHVNKGSHFRVEASGFMINSNAGGGMSKEIHPDGYGAWNWYVLSVRVGTKVIPVGSTGAGDATEEGALELGAPRSQNIFADDSKGVTGSWEVKLYATNAVQNNEGQGNVKVPSSSAEIEKAKTDLAFLKKVLTGEKIPEWNDPAEIAGQVRGIIYKYDLNYMEKSEIEECIQTIKTHYRYFFDMVGSPPANENKIYYSCVKELADELKIKIDNKTL